MYGDLFCHFSGNQPVLQCILWWPRQAEELVLILMDKSSNDLEYTDLVCFCVYIYREHRLPKPKVSIPGSGILCFWEHPGKLLSLPFSVSVNTHMGWAEPLQKLQVCVYSSRMSQFGMLSFLLVLSIGLQCSQQRANVYRRYENSQQIKWFLMAWEREDCVWNLSSKITL